ncbi:MULTISPECIES: FG-GAP repeat protein [unclassified Streptomyces]|uniref:FG-GAP repeat protein n=1 Tax=Streptomyces sp. NPDC127532 TaxID=3345399 RepID=UPI00363497EC
MAGHSSRTRRIAALAAMTAVAAGLSGGTAHAAPMPVPQDINGDGYRDLVVPAPAATVKGLDYAGSVVVLYGSAKGVSAAKRAVISQSSPGVPGAAEAGDWFGASASLADLDRDGFADLVVGAPGESIGSATAAGSATVLWGSKQGLVSGAALPTRVEKDGQAGRDVAAWSGPDGTSVLIVNDSTTTRLTGPFTRAGKAGSSTLHDETGWMRSAAFGDLNGDRAADRVLVSGRMGGWSGGLAYVNSALSDPFQSTHRMKGGDGLTPVIGDVNGDGYGDLVLGDPDDPGAVEGLFGHLGGAVHVWFGSAKGVSYEKAPMTIHQDTAGVPGGGERYDGFGASVAVADLNRDGLDDIVVGAPGEGIGARSGAGAVVVVPGLRNGQLGAGSYSFTQNTAGVPGGAEERDAFGCTVTAADLTRDARPELAVGACWEDGRGAVWVLPGGAAKPVFTSSVSFGTAQLGLPSISGTLLGGDHQQ